MTESHRTAVAAVAATAVLALAAGAACGKASPQPASGQRDDTVHRTLPVRDVIAGAAVNAQAEPLVQALAHSAGATR